MIDLKLSENRVEFCRLRRGEMAGMLHNRFH